MHIGVLCYFVVLAWTTHAFADVPMSKEHSSDMIVYLWWGLGLMGTFAATVSSATGVWILLRVLEHEKKIAAINARCELHDDDDDEK